MYIIQTENMTIHLVEGETLFAIEESVRYERRKIEFHFQFERSRVRV